jgi:hypothetical protein
MPTPEDSSRLIDAGSVRSPRGSEYYYRRPLSLSELVPAVALGIGAGFFAFYVTRVLLQRTPLEVEPGPRSARRAALEKSKGA